jgi:L-ribulose-5-phosphate 3-epimerase
MYLGIRAHDFGKLPLEELAGRVASAGFSCVQLAPPKAVAGFDSDAGRLSPGFAVSVREAFRRHAVQIAVLGCYINLADPNDGQRRFHLGRFKEYLRYARDFGCSVVGTETGSLNSDFSWHPENTGERAFQVVMESVHELIDEAERFSVFVGIEGVERFVISAPKRIRRLIDEIQSSNLQIIFDPVNLLNASNHRDQDAIMEESFALFGERIAIVHAKDFVCEDGVFRSVPAGEGMLNYDLFLRLVKRQKPYVSVLLEDTNPATMAGTAAFVTGAYARA